MKHLTAITFVLLAALSNSATAQDNDRQNERRQRPTLFQQFFTLPGVEFSNDQQAKIEEIRKEFVPKLTKNQDQWNSVITDEQQQARRQAFQEAREAGKEGQELRDAVDAALKLTADQRKQRAAIQGERNQLLSEIRTHLTALLTDEQQSQVRQTMLPNRISTE